MWLADSWREFSLLNAGNGMKLEKWGPYLLSRPEPQADVGAAKPRGLGSGACRVSSFRLRRAGNGNIKRPLPDQWEITYANKLRFIVRPTGFKHTGLFSGTGGELGLYGRKNPRGRAEGACSEPVCPTRAAPRLPVLSTALRWCMWMLPRAWCSGPRTTLPKAA